MTTSGSRKSGLVPGSVVGNRFEIERAVGDDALGTRLRAKDRKTGRPIEVRVLPPGLIATKEAVAALRSEVKTAALVRHKCIVATYGMGNDKTGGRFVATEWVEGQSIQDLVAERRAADLEVTQKAAIDVVTHVAEALTAVHAKNAVHGAVRPSVVFLTQGGRVKVKSVGVDRAIVGTVGPAALGASEQAFLAPEVKTGQTPDVRSDVFGLGGLLYAMLTGRSAADDFVAPSNAHSEADAAMDALLLKSLDPDPNARFASPAELSQALTNLSNGSAAAAAPPVELPSEEVGFELDVHVGSSHPPPSADGVDVPHIPVPRIPTPPRNSPVRSPVSGPPPVSAPPSIPEVGARIELNQSFRPDAPSSPVMSAEVDLSHLLSKITENDAPRWMVVKDKLDHGPFSGRELVNLILKGEILGAHGLLNMDTGERKKVGEAPEFLEFVEQWKLKKAASDHKVALARSAKVEKASTFTKAAVLGVVAAIVAALVGLFLVTRPDVQEEERASADIEDLYERGEIEITGEAGILEDPPRRSGRRRRSRRGGSLSYEDAMNQVVDLGNAQGSGSMSRLDPSQVATVMNRNINQLVPCLSQSPGGQITIDLAIAGSGQVLGASVRPGSPGFQSCISGRVRRFRFPHFNSPRMGARYSFSAN